MVCLPLNRCDICADIFTFSLSSASEMHSMMLQNRGVAVSWLLAFTFDHQCWDWATWKVVRDIVKPATEANRCRYTELPEVTEFVRSATIFMSHCWGGKWGDLVLAACTGARKDRVVWIDIFAVRQYPGNIADLSFRGVISKCSALIVATSVCDSLTQHIMHGDDERKAYLASPEGKTDKKKLAPFRVWCVVELAAATNMLPPVPVIIKSGELQDMNKFSPTTRRHRKVAGEQKTRGQEGIRK